MTARRRSLVTITATGLATLKVAEAAERVLEQKRGGWRGRWHAQNWWRILERYAFPRIGRRPVSEVNTADVLEVLSPIWHVKAETLAPSASASGRCWCGPIAMDLRADNPCDRVLPVLGPQNDMVTHRLALPHRDVVAAIETVRAGFAQPAVKLALPCTHIQGWTNKLPPCSVTAWSTRTRYYRPFVRLSRKLASSELWRRRR